MKTKLNSSGFRAGTLSLWTSNVFLLEKIKSSHTLKTSFGWQWWWWGGGRQQQLGGKKNEINSNLAAVFLCLAIAWISVYVWRTLC
jgi:hypothetical protein